MLKLLILACVFCWVQSVPCPSSNTPTLYIGYPICKSGDIVMFECDFIPNVVAKYCYVNDGSNPSPAVTTKSTMMPTSTPATTTPTPTPTTTPTPAPTTTPTPTPTTTPTPRPTTTPTPTPTTTPTPTPTTTPTPTPTTTPTPTPTSTSKPTTTAKPKTCGMYPVGGKMWNAEVVTDCQPWLVSLQLKDFHICNAVLISENTLITDIACIKKSYLQSNDIIPKINGEAIGSITKDSNMISMNGKGEGMMIIKLDKKVDTSKNCLKPVCVPKTRDDYDPDNCKVAAYGTDPKKPADLNVYMGKNINLLPKETCIKKHRKPTAGSTEVLPELLCSFPWVQGSSKGEKGGMLICKSKSTNNWMLAGVTNDESNGNLKADQPVYYWDMTDVPSFFDAMLQ